MLNRSRSFEGHHSLEKAILMNPGSLRSSQYFPVYLNESRDWSSSFLKYKTKMSLFLRNQQNETKFHVHRISDFDIFPNPIIYYSYKPHRTICYTPVSPSLLPPLPHRTHMNHLGLYVTRSSSRCFLLSLCDCSSRFFSFSASWILPSSKAL